MSREWTATATPTPGSAAPEPKAEGAGAAVAAGSGHGARRGSFWLAAEKHPGAAQASSGFILDTDIDTDCNDVGALDLLHALADSGEANLLRVVCDAPTPRAASCAAAIISYYGRSSVPVGALSWPGIDTDRRFDLYHRHVRLMESDDPSIFYNRPVTASAAGAGGKASDIWESVALYRKLLAGEPDSSVVIVAVGLLTALERLLASGPDEHSPLDGREIVAAKVSRPVTMGGGSVPEGRDTFNW
jgi:purine nucleosidase